MTTVLIFTVITAAVLIWYGSRRISALEKQLAALSDRLDTVSRKTGKKLTKYEKKLAHQQRKQRQQEARQEKLRKEQEKLSREQTKQAAQLRKMQFKLSQATADIEAAKIRLSSLYSLLDVAQANQAAQMPGSPADYRYQKQVTSLQHSISIAERQLEKAKFEAQEAKEGLAA